MVINSIILILRVQQINMNSHVCIHDNIDKRSGFEDKIQQDDAIEMWVVFFSIAQFARLYLEVQVFVQNFLLFKKR